MHRITQLAFSLGLLAFTGCTTMHSHGHHHAKLAGASESGLTVLGTGEAKAAPDLARSSIGIEVRNESAEVATSQANERMAAVIAAIKAAGVGDADVRTHDFSISFERDFTPPQPVVQVQAAPAAGKGGKPAPAVPPAPVEPRGIYRVSNTVEVTVRDIAKVSQVLTAATKAGANNVWGVSFELSDREPLHAKAREQAIAHARRDAEQLAKLTGVKLGRIVSIDDQADANVTPVYARAMAVPKAVEAPVPIEQGELTVTHQVRLVFALDGDD